MLLVGPPGTGKTHTATALGLAACRMGGRSASSRWRVSSPELAETSAEHRLPRLEAALDRLDME